MLPSVSQTIQPLVQAVMPVCVLLVLGYANFAVGYLLGYREIYRYHSHALAVVLWVLFGFCQLVSYYYWLRIYIAGPGTCPELPALDLYGNMDALPEYFMCDEDGYPYWCTSCQSLKAPRNFHSRRSGHCILKFDHYCLWLGTLLGLTNYIYFYKLVVWLLSTITIAVVYLAVYIGPNSNRGPVNGNIVAVLAVAGFWFIMAGGLLISHIWYILQGITTLDDVNLKLLKRYARYIRAKEAGKTIRSVPPRQEDGKRYINLRQPDGSRLVVRYDIRDRPYSFGARQNWIITWLRGNRFDYYDEVTDATTATFLWAIAVSIVPLAELAIKRTPRPEYTSVVELYNDHNAQISPSFRALIDAKIAAKKYKVASHYEALTEQKGTENDEARTA